MLPTDLFDGDIALQRSTLATPVGEIRFVVSHRAWSVGGYEDDVPHTQFSDFLAIAHHPDTGVMTMCKVRKETGGDARMACASAAQDLCLSIQAITAYIKTLEGPKP